MEMRTIRVKILYFPSKKNIGTIIASIKNVILKRRKKYFRLNSTMRQGR